MTARTIRRGISRHPAKVAKLRMFPHRNAMAWRAVYITLNRWYVERDLRARVERASHWEVT